MLLASVTRRLVGLRGLKTQMYPTGFTVRDSTPPVALHSAVALAVLEPGPAVGGVLVFSQLAWMSGSGAGPWQVSMPSPPSRLSWLPSLEAPMRVSLPSPPLIVSSKAEPVIVSFPPLPLIVLAGFVPPQSIVSLPGLPVTTVSVWVTPALTTQLTAACAVNGATAHKTGTAKTPASVPTIPRRIW